MSVISSRCGAPAPECLAVDLLADCAKAAIERDGTSVLSYGTGLGYLPLREWLGERYEIDPSQILLTNGSLQGFVYLAQHFFWSGVRRARAGRGAQLRSPASDPAQSRRRGDGDREWTTKGSTRKRSSVSSSAAPSRLSSTRSDLPEPERAHDLGRAPRTHRGAGPAIRSTRARRRPLRLRFVTRARRRRRCSRSRARSPSRLRTPLRSRRRSRPGSRRFIILPRPLLKPLELIASSTTISPSNLPAATVYEFARRGQLRAQPRADERTTTRPPRRRCSARSTATSARVRVGAGPRAATSTGSTCRGRRCRRAARARNSGGRRLLQGNRLLSGRTRRGFAPTCLQLPLADEIERGVAILAELAKA